MTGSQCIHEAVNGSTDVKVLTKAVDVLLSDICLMNAELDDLNDQVNHWQDLYGALQQDLYERAAL